MLACEEMDIRETGCEQVKKWMLEKQVVSM
jgi:hypothetical protein